MRYAQNYNWRSQSLSKSFIFSSINSKFEIRLWGFNLVFLLWTCFCSIPGFKSSQKEVGCFFFLFNVHLKVLHKNHSDRNWHLVLVYWFTLVPFFVCLQNLMGISNIIQIFVHQMTNVNSTIQNLWNKMREKRVKKECTLYKRVMIGSALNFFKCEWKSERTQFFANEWDLSEAQKINERWTRWTHF